MAKLIKILPLGMLFCGVLMTGCGGSDGCVDEASAFKNPTSEQLLQASSGGCSGPKKTTCTENFIDDGCN